MFPLSCLFQKTIYLLLLWCQRNILPFFVLLGMFLFLGGVFLIILLGQYMNLHLRIRISPLWMLCSFQWQLSECMFYNWNIQITVWIINKFVNKIVFFIIIKSSGGNSMLRRNYNIPFVSLPGNLLPIFCSGRYSCNSSFCWINCNLPSGRQDTWSQMFPREEYYI